MANQGRVLGIQMRRELDAALVSHLRSALENAEDVEAREDWYVDTEGDCKGEAAPEDLPVEEQVEADGYEQQAEGVEEAVSSQEVQ